MGNIVLGTSQWRKVEKWEKDCVKHDIKFTLNIKKSKIGFENRWYSLSMNVPNEIEKEFLEEVRSKWKPYNLRHSEL